MKIEDQCVSLDLAKKLKKLGVEQESLFYWVLGEATGRFYVSQSNEEIIGEAPDWETQECRTWYSAFTVAELLNILPERTELTKDKKYVAQYDNLARTQTQFSETAPNALALLLIELLENNLI